MLTQTPLNVESTKTKTYHPKVNDYVKWNKTYGPIEGWVYFYSSEYITIEVGTKEKEDDLVHFHKKTHILVLCYPHQWQELEYITSRPSGENPVPLSELDGGA